MSQIQFRPMATDDLAQIEQIATASFPTPWSTKTFWREIEKNERGHYWVLALEETSSTKHRRPTDCQPPREFSEKPPANFPKVVSYGGYWLLGEEAHIVTVATHPEWRTVGLGKLLLLNMLYEANNAGATSVTLEVRTSNHAAIGLYTSLGFTEQGRRKDYYKTDKDSMQREDALLLTLTPIEIDGHDQSIKTQHQKVIRQSNLQMSRVTQRG